MCFLNNFLGICRDYFQFSIAVYFQSYVQYHLANNVTQIIYTEERIDTEYEQILQHILCGLRAKKGMITLENLFGSRKEKEMILGSSRNVAGKICNVIVDSRIVFQFLSIRKRPYTTKALPAKTVLFRSS